MANPGIDVLKAKEQWSRYMYMRDNGHLEFIGKADKCDKFFAGLQWDQKDMDALNLAKRPALTINKIISTISTVMGEQIYNRMEVAFRPKSGAPSSMADTWNKLWTSLASANQLNWKRSDVFADGIIRSRGFYDVRLDFADSMVGEVRIERLNSKNVVIDPDADDYDPATWNDVIVSRWMTPEEIKILYSEEAGKELEQRHNSEFLYGFDSIERKRDRVAGPYTVGAYYDALAYRQMRHIRVLDRQFREARRVEFFVDKQTGDMREVPKSWDRDRIAMVAQKYDLAVVKKLTKKVFWRVTADTYVLHDDWSPYKNLTTVPYFPYFRDGKSIGLVENLLGPQELLNKASSQELHVINTTANSGWILRRGALQNLTIQELETSGAKTGLVLEVDDVKNIEKITPNQIPSGLERITFKAEESIKTISNVSDSMQGFDREDVAAKAIQAKKASSSVNFTKITDNLERSDYFLARSVMEIVQEFYTEPRVMRYTHENLLGEPGELQLNTPQEDGSILNDLTQGEFDIVVTSAPYRATLEDSQFEQAVALRELGIPIPDDVLIENSRLMRKNEIARRMKEANETPEAKAKQALEMRGMNAEVASKEAEAAEKTASSQLKVAQSQKALADAQAGKNPAEEMDLERMKAAEEARIKQEQQAFEMQMKEREMAFKEHMAEREMAFKQQIAEREAQVKEESMRRESEARAMAARTAAVMGSGPSSSGSSAGKPN